MDKTKKYTLIFVVVSFLLIASAGVYQLLTPSSLDKQDVVENKKEDKDKGEQADGSLETSDKLDIKNNQKKETPQEKETNDKKPNQEVNQKNEPSSQPKEEPVELKEVQLIITGINETITSGMVKVQKDQTVYDALKKMTNEKGIELKASGASTIVYIRGINGLNEFDKGPRSGWKYTVNGTYPNKSAGSYKVENGDRIEWIYTIE